MTEASVSRERTGLQERLGYAFRDESLLARALTHSSLRDRATATNERLEFLGDAVLGMVVSEHLFREHEDFDEGDLTQVKSVVVSARNLAARAREMDLAGCLRVGKGLKGPLPDSLLADAFEAVVAAVFLDGGLETARELLLRTLGDSIRRVLEKKHEKNHKSLLQAFVQKKLRTTPRYMVISEEGPDHGKTFEVAARVGRRTFPPGRGRSKKEAEQRAAAEALRELRAEARAAEESGQTGEEA